MYECYMCGEEGVGGGRLTLMVQVDLVRFFLFEFCTRLFPLCYRLQI